MKRKVISILLTSAMVLSMAACGSDGSDAGSSSAADDTAGDAADDASGDDSASVQEGTSDDDNTLTVWCWDPNFNIYAIEKAAEIYAKDHEGFSVEISEIQSDDIESKITTAVNAGDLSTLPDIFLMQDNSFQKYTSFYPDVFTDLSDVGIDYSQFSEAKVAYSTLNGVHYGIPFDNGTVVNCIRVDILEEAGYTIDDFTDITWSDYMEKAKVVLEKTGHPMLSGQAHSAEIVAMALQSCGGSMFNEDGSVNIQDNEALKEACQNYQQMVADGTFQEVNDWDQYIASFNNGTVASAINGCWIMASVAIPEDQSGLWAVTNMPRLDNAPNATNYSNQGGSSWAISSNCQKVDLAADFLNATFAGNTDFYDDIIQKGALATWTPAGETDVYNQEVEYWGNDTVYAKIVEFAANTPASVTGPFFYDARDAVSVAVSEMVQNGTDMDEALKTAQETVEFNMGV